MSRRRRQNRPQSDETEEGNPPTSLTHLFERYRLRLSRNRAPVASRARHRRWAACDIWPKPQCIWAKDMRWALCVAIIFLVGTANAEQLGPPLGNYRGVGDIRFYCLFDDKLFSIGAILCAGEGRSFQCIAADRDISWAHWTTYTVNNQPPDGCKVPTPLQTVQ